MGDRERRHQAFRRRVSQRVRYHRERQRMTQADLARATGYLHTSISNIETNRQCPTLFMACGLAAALGIDLNQLIQRRTRC